MHAGTLMGRKRLLLLYKRTEDGLFSWQCADQEAVELTWERYYMLVTGLDLSDLKIKGVNLWKIF